MLDLPKKPGLHEQSALRQVSTKKSKNRLTKHLDYFKIYVTLEICKHFNKYEFTYFANLNLPFLGHKKSVYFDQNAYVY